MKRCLITAGPTREHFDPVRYLSNGSSGKMGYALAAEALRLGWEVDLVTGPVSLRPPSGAIVHRVTSALEMREACLQVFPHCQLLIMAAAVADYRPAERLDTKSAKSDGPLQLQLIPNPDILAQLATGRLPGQILVGFAAETDQVEAKARAKLTRKGLDWIVANDVSSPELGMEADRNAITMLSRTGKALSFGPADKADVAAFILGTLDRSPRVPAHHPAGAP